MNTFATIADPRRISHFSEKKRRLVTIDPEKEVVGLKSIFKDTTGDFAHVVMALNEETSEQEGNSSSISLLLERVESFMGHASKMGVIFDMRDTHLSLQMTKDELEEFRCSAVSRVTNHVKATKGEHLKEDPFLYYTYLRKDLKKFSDKHGDEFRKWWTSDLSTHDRKKLVTEVLIGIPVDGNYPSKNIDGADSTNVRNLAPGWDIENLCVKNKGSGLLGILKYMGKVGSSAEEYEQVGGLSLMMLPRYTLDMNITNQFAVHSSDNIPYKFDVIELSDPKYLHTIQPLVETGYAVPYHIFRMILTRMDIYVQGLNCIIWEFKTEVLKNAKLKDSGKFIYGATCQASGCYRTKRADGKKLYYCQRCSLARYCTKEHQKAHWKVHKLTCRKKD